MNNLEQNFYNAITYQSALTKKLRQINRSRHILSSPSEDDKILKILSEIEIQLNEIEKPIGGYKWMFSNEIMRFIFKNMISYKRIMISKYRSKINAKRLIDADIPEDQFIKNDDNEPELNLKPSSFVSPLLKLLKIILEIL